MNFPLLPAALEAARSALLAFCLIASALAQSTATPPPGPGSSSGPVAPGQPERFEASRLAPPSAPLQLERFEVTGSLIKQAEIEGPSPVRFITREEIDLSGMDNLTDIIREIPEATNLFENEGSTTGFIRGAAAIDLRFLGPNNTLVLVDGRRQAPNGISNSTGTVFVDLNRIPVSSIERVEVLKDGATSVYGSDATAGVINIITRKDHVGLEVTARYGNYFKTDGAEQSYSVFGGTRAGRLRVNFNASYTSRHANAAIDQPFSASADQTERWRAYDAQKYALRLLPTATAASQYDGRSATGPYATVGVPTAAQLANNGLTVAAIRNPLTGATATLLPGTGGVPAGTLGSSGNYASVPRGNNPARPTAADFVPRAYPPGEFSNSYNFQTFVWNVPERETRNLSVGFGYGLPYGIDFEAAVMAGRIESETRLAPSPASTSGDNDILVPASNYYNPFGIPVAFTYRPLEVGPRIANITSESLGYRAGLRGMVLGRFDWDIGWSYS
ncbi:MAG: hypothetical protein FJ399_23850, partial [Verrucomicrobia bacterium]|nr:hypothetical protein [Verrucomicrobiota bacterium]